VNEGRRLLERLEHPVGRLVVHRVGALDDEYAACRLERGPRGGVDDRAHVVDQQLVRAARRDPHQVGMGSVLDAGGHPGGVGGPLGQQDGRESLRDGALPRPRRAVEHVGVAGPPSGR
jgi:hypothetical protein